MTKQFEENSKMLIGDVLSPVPKQKKIKKSEYQETGLIPVIDQGSDFIAGYTDDLDRAYRGGLPVIVFGDHTRVLKFVSFRFSAGADGTQVLKPIQEFDERYFYYSLVALNLKNYGYERHFKYLKEEKIIFRPLPIQRKIAAILSAYDDLIENNTRRIQILEEMAQRIYQEWFVNFCYPGHENDQLVKSELGMIPVGWEVKKLREFVLNVRQSERAGDHLLSIPYVPIDCIPRKSLFLNSAKPGSEAKSSLISFQKYDVLFGAMRSYFHKVVISPFNGTTRTTCFVLRPIDPGYYVFTVLTLFQESTIDFANSHSRGSTMPYAVWDVGLAEMPAIYPSKEVALDFNKIIEPMLKRIALGFFEQKNLRQTRDFLLPKLISGKIDVSELDIDIGETDDSLQ